MNAQLKPAESCVGIFTDVPAETYHQRRLDEAIASGLKHMLRSPTHFKHHGQNPADATIVQVAEMAGLRSVNRNRLRPHRPIRTRLRRCW